MVTFHPRSTWVTTEPVTGPAMPWKDIDTQSIHYTAAVNLIDGDPGEFVTGIPAYLRRIHHDYLVNRPTFVNGVKTSTGYSIGYNFAVDWLGGVWELRGFGIKCAANSGENGHTVAILCLVDGADPLTDEALGAVRWIVAECEKRAGRELLIKGHQEIGATACPGVGIMGQIRAGKLSPRYVVEKPKPLPEEPPVVRPEPPTPRENLMIGVIHLTDAHAQFIGYYTGDGVFLEARWISTARQIEARDNHLAAGARQFTFPKAAMRSVWVDKIPLGDGLTVWTEADVAGVG